MPSQFDELMTNSPQIKAGMAQYEYRSIRAVQRIIQAP